MSDRVKVWIHGCEVLPGFRLIASGGLLLLTVCVLLGALDACHADDTVPEVVAFRGGVPNFCRVLPVSVGVTRNADRRRVVYFGSDFLFHPDAATPSPHMLPIPEAAHAKENSFIQRLTHYFPRELHPNTRVARSLSTTDAPAWEGAFRIADRGILARYLFQPEQADLVVLDFAAGDRKQPEPIVVAGLEGMVRQVWTTFPEADILFLYAPHRDFLNDYRAGRVPRSIQWHEQVAAHYGIPSVNLAKFIADRILSGELSEDEVFLSDGVVSDAADRLCLDAVKPLFERSRAMAEQAAAMEPHALPAPVGRYPIDQPSVVSYEVAERTPGWRHWQESPLEHILHILRCDESGPELTLRFQGDVVALTHIAGPDSGDIEFSLNGSDWIRRTVARGGIDGAYEPESILLAEGLDASVAHTLTLRLASGDAANGANGAGTTLRIVDFLVNGSVEGTEPYAGMTALERIDAIYAEMEPVRYEPSPDRWTYLPRTMRKLEEGPALTLVMLGSSVVGDTGRSNFELLLQRLYPNCAIRKIMSLQGGAGCEFFKGEGRIQRYVLRHEPDLVVIGGMTRGTVPEAMASIRDVIAQIRAGKPDTEILLLTRTFGRRHREDPNRNPEWQEFVSPDGSDYRSAAMKLAGEEQVEFLDMHGIWGRYLLDSAYPSGAFMRDQIHANPRGQQILGRILERYFAPKQ